MKGKKVVLIITTVIMIAVILGIVIGEFMPKPVVSDTKNISVYNIIYYGSQISINEDRQNFYTIMNDGNRQSKIAIDEDELVDILRKYNAKRTFENHFPYQRDKVDIEIEIIENHRPKHILLGEFNIWYESADKGSYKILNGQQLMDELKHTIEEHLNEN